MVASRGPRCRSSSARGLKPLSTALQEQQVVRGLQERDVPRYDDHGAAGIARFEDAGDHRLLATIVEVRRWLVQNEERRVAIKGAREVQKLSLALARLVAISDSRV